MKATGPPLIQELRKMGLTSRRWAPEVVDAMAAFPPGEHGDLHDAAVLGSLRLRPGGVRIPTDAEEEERQLQPPWRIIEAALPGAQSQPQISGIYFTDFGEIPLTKCL
jgi:hypothetical protein